MEVSDQNIVALKESISTDREERRLLRSVTCLNLKVFHRLCTEGNRSPMEHLRYPIELFKHACTGKLTPISVMSHYLQYFICLIGKQLFLFLNYVYVLSVCFLSSLLYTIERMRVSICLSVI